MNSDVISELLGRTEDEMPTGNSDSESIKDQITAVLDQLSDDDLNYVLITANALADNSNDDSETSDSAKSSALQASAVAVGVALSVINN